ncbi:uncharacterized protein LOC125709420 isoform X11 [Brienomyrus brachyistius]|uniref:uncharacterized protein LOC125709420 isoform X11 n=1 Tax=Brienomyrus brachyistius TaxID=42636 RepID=UPI0020B19AE8|nr:uncharacterized protein LOC125709420 isoform X11 [Brienomyrus brachyistius]
MVFRALILTAIMCCIGNFCDGREDKEVFGRVGGEVTLKPTVVQPITSITWKNGLNKAAEWDRNSNIDYYTRCKSAGPRCRLNTTTGELTIMQLTLNEELDLSPEINEIAAQSFFSVIVLEPVSKPSVRQTCDNNQCTLVCEGESTTYTKYSWKENNEMVADDTTTLHVQKSDKLDKIYTCVISNPVSSEESDSVKESDLFPGREVKEVFGRVGGEVTLIPKVEKLITSITWKNGLNKAAEWDRNSNIDYYTRCKSAGPRCRLNTTTGELTIMQLTLNEELDLSPEINEIAAQSFFSVIVLEPVSKPSVRQTCDNNQCTLVCEGESTTYTKYSWKENNEMVADDTTTLHVQKSDKLDKIYTCVISNPVSSEESDPVKESDLFPGREVKEVFGRVGGEVTLIPKVEKLITSITWKNGLNKAAEWDRNSNTDYYTRCKSAGPRCRLNTATGELTIMQLTLNEELDLSPEINGIAAQSFFSVIVLEPVSKPSVRKTCENNQCTLVCEGESTTYTKYSWKENNKMVADNTTTLHVQKSDKLDKIYTCVISNPVSSAESDPVKESDLFSVMEVKEVFGIVRGEVTLIPKVEKLITSITWKNGLDKAAEWNSVNGTVFYTICKVGQRCQLNSTTGGFHINILKLAETLNFTAAINGNAPISCFSVIILEPVSKPSVRKTCDNNQCTLVCEGENTTYTKYSWKENNKMVADDNTTLHVQKSDKLDKIYTCVISNPVSSAESDPVKESDLFPGGRGRIILCVVSAIFVAAVCCVIVLCYKKKAVHLMNERPDNTEAVRLMNERPDNTEAVRLMNERPDNTEADRLMSERPDNTEDRLMSERPDNTEADRLMSERPENTEDRLMSERPENTEADRLMSERPENTEADRLMSERPENTEAVRLMNERPDNTEDRLMNERPENTEDTVKFEDNNGEHVEMQMGP